jgi:hypothetical protein
MKTAALACLAVACLVAGEAQTAASDAALSAMLAGGRPWRARAPPHPRPRGARGPAALVADGCGRHNQRSGPLPRPRGVPGASSGSGPGQGPAHPARARPLPGAAWGRPPCSARPV